MFSLYRLLYTSAILSMRALSPFRVSVLGLVLSINASPSQADVINNSPNLGYEELWRLQNQFYETFRYPNNVKEAEAINSTVFSEDVQGRVSQTRNFEGRELNTEYIFGLFVPSESMSIIGRPGAHEVIQFAANQNIAAATTRVNFTFPAFNNYSVPVIIETWMSWNSNKEINQYDVTFRWFGYLLNTLIASMNTTDPKDALTKTVARLSDSICAAHENHCHGENAQFKDRDECFNFMTKEIRVGQDFEMGMDTLLCRSVHEVMIKYRPDVHCSHVGRDGGGMCDDSISYRMKAEEQYYRNTPWIPTQV